MADMTEIEALRAQAATIASAREEALRLALTICENSAGYCRVQEERAQVTGDEEAEVQAGFRADAFEDAAAQIFRALDTPPPEDKL